jgi:hypothetical protein
MLYNYVVKYMRKIEKNLQGIKKVITFRNSNKTFY